jgi:hypothetical protein
MSMKRLLINLKPEDAERAEAAAEKLNLSVQSYIRDAALRRLDGIDAADLVRIALAIGADQQRDVLAKAIEELFELSVALRNELTEQNKRHFDEMCAAVGIDRTPPVTTRSAPPIPQRPSGPGTAARDIADEIFKN